MKTIISITDKRIGRASERILGNNIEAYENTVPRMLSDRLRNPKFAGPGNHQTGIATEWEPIGNTMQTFSARLLPGVYLSGREAQQIHNFSENAPCGILQHGVKVRKGERYEVEIWARAQHRPVVATVCLHFPGHAIPEESQGNLNIDHAHWHRRTCTINSPGDGEAYFKINIPGDSRIVIDQIHLRPVAEPHVSQAFLDAFNAFPCPILRFPGGCATCTYHWEHGTGPVHLRPVCDDPVFKYKMHYDFGTDEYLELCVARKMIPQITLNTTTATPEDAAAWAAYVRAWYASRKLPIPAAYFMFGNENYGTWEMGHMTGAMYVAQLREFVPAVRAAYPEARMMAIGQVMSGGIRSDQASQWRDVVVKEAADLFDVLAVTRYAWAKDSLDLNETMKVVADNVADKAADLAEQIHVVRNANLSCKVGIVEWNLWTRASHNDHEGFFEPNDIRHCLYASGYINIFSRQGDRMEVANYYSLVNTMGMIHVHDGAVEISDVAKVFNLYADALPGDVMDITYAAPKLTEKSKTIDANVIRTGNAVYVFITNYSTTQSMTATLDGAGKIQKACGLKAKAILTPVTEFTPACKDATVTVPPMSFIRITCALPIKKTAAK